MDFPLKPYLKVIKSYVWDSVEFLNEFSREVDPNTKIVTFDVTSLYASIPMNIASKI